MGYRHYADDVVERFTERAVKNGMDVFRVFDAMNDPRNMKAALQAVRSHGAHAQGTLSYTTSPAHTLQTWLDLTEQLLETGVDSIAIKDMSGILTPSAAFELVSEIKKTPRCAATPALPRHHRNGGDGPAEGHRSGR
ncbi:Methylmalonyl-CoA carboxyltransferase 5S subunit [Citrobacter freundii]|nr:Methylmalonyl-CoA carboxyltransferase 5S subunit [Citrobacter freundii]